MKGGYGELHVLYLLLETLMRACSVQSNYGQMVTVDHRIQVHQQLYNSMVLIFECPISSLLQLLYRYRYRWVVKRECAMSTTRVPKWHEIRLLFFYFNVQLMKREYAELRVQEARFLCFIFRNPDTTITIRSILYDVHSYKHP